MDILIHGATNHQSTNSAGPQGGQIDPSKLVALESIDTPSQIILSSSDNTDTNQIYAISGITESRLVKTEFVTLNGQSNISTQNIYRRLHEINKISTDPTNGVVTIKTDAKILGQIGNINNDTTQPEITSLINMMQNVFGRATVNSAFYEKFFIKNAGNETIDKLQIIEYQSDSDENILFAADATYNGDSYSINRTTKPIEIQPGDLLTDTDIIFTNMNPGDSLGVWIRLLINAGEKTILHNWSIKVIINDTDEFIFKILHPEAIHNTLNDIITTRNNHQIGGFNHILYAELYGAKFVQQLFYEPDPKTFRDQYYYNTRLNRLFKKMSSGNRNFWKLVR